MARLSRRFRFLTFGHWPGPRSLATTSGVSVDVLSSGYLDVSVRRVCLTILCIQIAITPKGWVSPFGNPRIKACSQLPVAYRSVLRPSSPLSAKASTKCPFALDCRVVAYRGKPRQRYVSDFISNILAPQNSLYTNREGRRFEYFVGSGLQPIHDVQQRNRTNDEALLARNFCFVRPISRSASVAAPAFRCWWSWTESNRRPPACKAGALPTELQPHPYMHWWAWEDLNFRPHAYQARALTN